MTVVLQSTGFHGYGMEEQCLDVDDAYFTDTWETSNDELTFLCSNQSDEDEFPAKDRGIKRSRESELIPQQPLQHAGISTNVILNATTGHLEQGKFLLQVSFDKLRRVEDPEACLRRSVLINNTLKLVHNQLYGVKTPFGLTGAMTVDSQNIDNGPLSPARKRSRFATGELCDSCPRTKSPDNRFIRHESECESCTLAEVLANNDMENDVFRSDSLHFEKESSILSELDSVFHSFVCALET